MKYPLSYQKSQLSFRMVGIFLLNDANLRKNIRFSLQFQKYSLPLQTMSGVVAFMKVINFIILKHCAYEQKNHETGYG